MYVAPENSLTHKKAASFASLVQIVYTIESIYTSSDLIRFVSQQLLVDTSSALQESQSVSMSIHESVFFLSTSNHLHYLTAKCIR